MKKIFWLLPIVAWMTFYSCTCKHCDDPKLITVPASGSHILSHWHISQAVKHSNGTMTSSISIVPHDLTTVTSVAVDSVIIGIDFTSEDTIGGIKSMRLESTFSFNCTNAVTHMSTIVDGILPVKVDEFDSPLTTCCLRTYSIHGSDIGKPFRCAPGLIISNAHLRLTAWTTSCTGVQDTSYLTVAFH